LSELDLVKQEEIIGKTVVNMKAEKLGEVKDVAFHTSGKKALIVISPQGVDRIYPFDQAVAIKDIILLDENKTQTMLKTPVPVTTPVSYGTTPAPVSPPPPIPRFQQPPPGNIPSMTTRICPSCKRENRLQSKFCVQCGKPL
jgi:sporulation protein YlmC with PRC-barrel domain